MDVFTRFVVGRLRCFAFNRLFAFLWKNNNGEYEFRLFTKAELVTFYLHNYTSITPILFLQLIMIGRQFIEVPLLSK